MMHITLTSKDNFYIEGPFDDIHGAIGWLARNKKNVILNQDGPGDGRCNEGAFTIWGDWTPPPPPKPLEICLTTQDEFRVIGPFANIDDLEDWANSNFEDFVLAYCEEKQVGNGTYEKGNFCITPTNRKWTSIFSKEPVEVLPCKFIK